MNHYYITCDCIIYYQEKESIIESAIYVPYFLEIVLLYFFYVSYKQRFFDIIITINIKEL